MLPRQGLFLGLFCTKVVCAEFGTPHISILLFSHSVLGSQSFPHAPAKYGHGKTALKQQIRCPDSFQKTSLNPMPECSFVLALTILVLTIKQRTPTPSQVVLLTHIPIVCVVNALSCRQMHFTSLILHCLLFKLTHPRHNLAFVHVSCVCKRS